MTINYNKIPHPKEKEEEGFWSDTHRDKRHVKRL